MSRNRRNFLGDKKRSHRKRKPVILLLAEGNDNKTEKEYFKYFKDQKAKYSVIVQSSGDTDLKSMAEALAKKRDQLELDVALGDKCFIVADLDLDKEKSKWLRNNISKYSKKGIGFIISNPCFEVWYLFHFTDSTHPYSDNKEVIKALRKYIPGYMKSTCPHSDLKENTGLAISNAAKVEQAHIRNGKSWISVECNPMTDVYKLLSIIMGII